MLHWLNPWMRRWLLVGGRAERKRRPLRRSLKAHLTLERLEDRALMSANFVQTNLVSDLAGMAAVSDPNLVNPWGLVAAPGGPFWAADNGTGLSTLYNGQGAIQSLVVNVPDNAGATTPHGTPTGIVFNTAGTGFDVSAGGKTGSSVFLFDTLDGTIAGWSPGVNLNNAFIAVKSPGSVFTGLAIGTDAAGQTLLYAVDHAKGVIDVYDQNFNLITRMTGGFQDPNLPAGADPFNIQNINGQLYVEYTVKSTSGAAIQGAVDVFNTNGQLVPNRLIDNSALNSPWGVALAPADFGQFSNDLLVGNFGDGHINAFNPATNQLVGQLTLANGQPFEEDHLWSLQFGNGAVDKTTGAVLAPTNTLYFTAGINGEKDGLFGALQAPPSVAANAPVLPNLPVAVQQTITTTSATGEGNPYGVTFVPQGFEGKGLLQPGDLLVSNFNGSSGIQGTGTTIQLITPEGQYSTFFTSTQIGLSTALGVLKSGFVIVGNVPNVGGIIGQGALQIIDANGHLVATLTNAQLLDGPWDLTINDQGNFAQVFVANVLSGTVTRIDLNIPTGGKPQVLDMTQIASGYVHRTDPNALVVGPTGLAFDATSGTLFVASTGDNAIFAIAHAATIGTNFGTGLPIVENNAYLHGPLGLVLAPNGDLIVANGDAVNPGGTANDLVEFDQSGDFIGDFPIDTGAPGAAFGVAISSANGALVFAAVDDNTNTVIVWTLGIEATGQRQGAATAAVVGRR